ncbi:MAG: DUF1993 domain-containing protein [Betaproteobacteria bacterium]|nr:DUF1993 domain-containing protein [Betaproteobacteria bacterium]
MALSMYQASAPRFANTLKNLSAILDKAQAHCEARKIEPEVLVSLRLFPDMYPLSRQVQITCDTAKGAVARLAGMEIPKHEDGEKTLAELKARIASTLAFIESAKPAQIDGSEEKEIVLKLGGQETKFKGLQYLLGFAQPNFYFHAATAYNILRSNGVDVGKKDFIGQP